MTDTAFVLLGSEVTWLEVVAFALALGCVACNIREVHWGWPLAFASSLLYGWLFLASRLYGEAWLQVFFALIAVWGWCQWLRGSRSRPRGADAPAPQRAPLQIASLGRARMALALVGWALAWIGLGLVLRRFTDTDVPFLDAFPTAGSVLGQILLGRKFIESWIVWAVVNLASVALFSFKGLWLTTLLYLAFTVMSVIGWRSWRARTPAHAAGGALAEHAR